MAATENLIEKIDIAYPDDASELNLRVSVGACQLQVKPGEGPSWVNGTYRHPHDTLPLKVELAGGSARISQETNRLGGLWDMMDRDSVPRFDLSIGKARPFALVLEVGASDNEIDLGGLPIGQLIIKQGAGKAIIDFPVANPQVMDLLDVSAGASGLEMRHLGNANFTWLRLEGGAAGFQLDFGGNLQAAAHVTINTGVAGVDVSVPSTTAVKATVESVMGGVDLGYGFMKKEGAYWNEAALAGHSPLLTIDAKIALGGLKLRATS